MVDPTREVARSIRESIVKLDEARRLFGTSEALSEHLQEVFLGVVDAVERHAHELLTAVEPPHSKH